MSALYPVCCLLTHDFSDLSNKQADRNNYDFCLLPFLLKIFLVLHFQFLCVCVFICICRHMCTHVNVNVCMQMCVHVCVFMCIRRCVCTCVFMCMCRCVCSCVYADVCTHVDAGDLDSGSHDCVAGILHSSPYPRPQLLCLR